MIQKGTVVHIQGEYAYVLVRRSNACEGCHRERTCDDCTATMMTVKARNCCSAAEQDVVEVSTSDQKLLFYALAVFVLPFVPAFLAYFLGELLFDAVSVSVVFFLSALVLTFLVLRLTLDRRARDRCDLQITAVVKEKTAE